MRYTKAPRTKLTAPNCTVRTAWGSFTYGGFILKCLNFITCGAILKIYCRINIILYKEVDFMAVFKCKMCGANLIIQPDQLVVECNYCDTVQTVPALDSEKKANLFNRANRLRMNGEFDKAAGVYENIIAEFPKEAEAYWGLCLSNYGIEYVDDPATAKKVPTCHRASFEKLVNDENFKLALENSTYASQQIYMEEAKEIDRIMEDILMTVRNEKPYDVFICYKETDEFGSRTIDSVLAQDVYDALTAKGMKVFFARITLEDKLGKMYEPYIFSALNSAKVMLAIGTTADRFEAVWVRNEWSRFLKLMSKDKSRVLIPCYKDMDAYDLPEEFKMLQAQDMSKIGFMQDLVRGVEKIVGIEERAKAEEKASADRQINEKISPLLERVFMFLEDGDWKNADEYCEKVLDIEPKNAMAYIGKLMVELKVKKREDLALQSESFADNQFCIKALRFADDGFATIINGYIETIVQRNNLKLAQFKYNDAWQVMQIAANPSDYRRAAQMFNKIADFNDSAEKEKECIAKAEEIEEANRERSYNQAVALMNNAKEPSQLSDAANKFSQLSGYRDSQELAKQCRENIPEMKYSIACTKMQKANDVAAFNDAINGFSEIINFKDSENLRNECREKIKEIKYTDACRKFESAKTIDDFSRARNNFLEIKGYKDCASYYDKCQDAIKSINYNDILQRIEKAKTSTDFENINIALSGLGKYKDSEELIKKCTQLKKEALEKEQQAIRAKNQKREEYEARVKLYESAKRRMNSNTIEEYKFAIEEFNKAYDIKDSKEQIEKCRAEIKILEDKARREKIKNVKNTTVKTAKMSVRVIFYALGLFAFFFGVFSLTQPFSMDSEANMRTINVWLEDGIFSTIMNLFIDILVLGVPLSIVGIVLIKKGSAQNKIALTVGIAVVVVLGILLAI